MKRITAIVGHYGSGKTEFSVNMAIDLKKRYEKVSILDMDIANPYFRSRERQTELEALGIQVHHNAYGYDITEDLPAISAGLRGPLENKEYMAVVDVGGDDSGARIINQFKKYFVVEDAQMLCVVNGNRPETENVEGALRHIERIQAETGIIIQGIINNTHLLKETTATHIISGHRLCKEVSSNLGIPVVYDVCHKDLVEDLEAAATEQGCTDLNIYPITLYMRPSWLDR